MVTEKRFTYDKPLVAFSKGGIEDNVTGETYEFTMDTVLDLLNEQHEENTKMKEALKELKEIGDYQADRIKELDEENQQIESTIKEAYQTERTAIGKSVLKQLLETIQ